MTQTKKIVESLGISATVCLSQGSGYEFIPNSHIVIATPKAFQSNFAPKMNRGKQTSMAAKHSPADVKLVIVDEADYFYTEMENREIIKKVFKVIPPNSQKLLFTATLEDETRKNIVEDWLDGKDPFIAKTEIIMDNTIHTVYNCVGKGEKGKLDMIEKIFNLECFEEGFKAIVFCKQRKGVDEVYNQITKMGFNCSRYRGDMDYKDKDEQYAKFLKSENKVLISTDVMARGIDIVTIAIVVNYDLPMTKDATDQMIVSPITYVHRTGRAGRFGRKCFAMSMLSEEKDVENMEKIKQYVSNRFKKDLFQDVAIDTLESLVSKQLKDQTADTEVEKENGNAVMDNNVRKDPKSYKKEDDEEKKGDDGKDKKNAGEKPKVIFE